MNGDPGWLRGTATATSTIGAPVHVCGSICVGPLRRGSGAGPCVSVVRVHVRAARIRCRGVSPVRRGCAGPCAPGRASASARGSMCADPCVRVRLAGPSVRVHLCHAARVHLRPTAIGSGVHPPNRVVARVHLRVDGVGIRVRVHLRGSMCAAAPPRWVGTPGSDRGAVAFARRRMHHVPC